jgi:peptide/nickel transport system permease protein
MWSLILRRLLLTLPTLVGASLIVFAMVKLAPGDPISILMPPDAGKAEIEAVKEALGLDRPLPVQYLKWLERAALHGDLGRASATRRPVVQDVRDALRNSLTLALASSALALLPGLALGTLAAFYRGGVVDKMVSAVAITGVSVPHYWAGIILIVVFSVQLGWLPAMGGPSDPGVGPYLRHMLLPAVALALIPLGVITRVVRSAVLDILAQEFVLTLRVKGLRTPSLVRHVLKNASPQILTVTGLQFGFALGGSVLVETVFSWPGTGYLLNIAIFQRDMPLLQGIILVLSTVFVLLNLAVDVLQGLIDPRIARG